MNLLIVRVINYENKNKNKKFNSALKTRAFENKNEFKSHKDKNKSETKFKKSNEISMSDNVKKKKLMSFNLNLSSDLFTQTQLKILAISKKNSSWYLDSNISFHISDKKNKFMNLQKITESS